jgi:hypothetical protein
MEKIVSTIVTSFLEFVQTCTDPFYKRGEILENDERCHAIAQAVRCWLLTVEVRVQS